MKLSLTAFIAFFFSSISASGQGSSTVPREAEPKRFTITYIQPQVFDDPVLVKGLQWEDLNNERYLCLKKGSSSGLAEDYFYDAGGTFDIEMYYRTDSGESTGATLSVNEKVVGKVSFHPYKGPGRHSIMIRDIAIPKWSKIELRFYGKKDRTCRIGKVIFIRQGESVSKEDLLRQPHTLKLYQNEGQRLFGRSMLSDFVNGKVDTLMHKRIEGLSLLKTPEDWREYQEKTRAHLETFFGKFPPRTPLHPVITGKVIHDQYIVENLYFQSRPGFYVTANLYIPKLQAFPAPGVLFTCGHSDIGKASDLYQDACIGLALKGYVVLSFDPSGEGERIEYFNKKTKKETVMGPVSQHYYLGRPLFLMNQTFSGLRVWDAMRALDYLVSRKEVDTSRLAAVGNSGGGQMALLITAVDPRIKVCAAGHPGGQMEKNYLTGQNLIDRQIFSLIAPRPVRIIVGRKSGEAPYHLKKIEDIQLFDQGLGYSRDRAQMVLVDGVHDLKYPKRQEVYDWLNKWFDKEREGNGETEMHTADPKALWATKAGYTRLAPGSLSGQILISQMLKNNLKSKGNPSHLKEQIARTIGFDLHAPTNPSEVQFFDTLHYGTVSVEKVSYQSEQGIMVPSLLIRPMHVKAGSPVFVFASDRGKPRIYGDSILPFLLAKNGYTVLAIDVRGVGETSPTPELPVPGIYSGCTSFRWLNDCLAIQSPGFGRTMIAMRTLDVTSGVDLLKSFTDLKDRKIVVIGSGEGGVWAILSALFDKNVSGVITENTLVSYQQLVTHQYYAVPSSYFWAPGLLLNFDIADLVRITSDRPQIWINPVNGLYQPLKSSSVKGILGVYDKVSYSSMDEKNNKELIKEITSKRY